MHVVFIIVSLMAALFSNVYFAVGATILLFAGYLLFMYSEGSSIGEEQCTMTDTVRKIRDSGKTPTKDQLSRCFNPKNGIVACIVLSLPGLIIAIMNLIFVDPTAETLTDFARAIKVIKSIWLSPLVFLTRLCEEIVYGKTDIAGATQAAAGVVSAFKGGRMNAVELVTNTKSFSQVYTYVTDYTALRVLHILYIPFAVLPPLAQLIGYLRGPKLRAKTLNDMMKGSNKKLRRMRRQRTHAPRVKGPEI